MRFAFYPVPYKSDSFNKTIWGHFFLRKSGVFDIPKQRSPGRSPEGKVWFPGRVPGRVFHLIIGLISFLTTFSHFSKKQRHFSFYFWIKKYYNKRDLPKSRSPGRFPEGKGGFPGRVPEGVVPLTRRYKNKKQPSYIYIVLSYTSYIITCDQISMGLSGVQKHTPNNMGVDEFWGSTRAGKASG